MDIVDPFQTSAAPSSGGIVDPFEAATAAPAPAPAPVLKSPTLGDHAKNLAGGLLQVGGSTLASAGDLMDSPLVRAAQPNLLSPALAAVNPYLPKALQMSPETIMRPNAAAYGAVGNAISSVGDKIKDTQGDTFKQEAAKPLVTGSLMHPSTLQFGAGIKSPTAIAANVENLATQAVPLLLGGLETKGTEALSSAASRLLPEALDAAPSLLGRAKGVAAKLVQPQTVKAMSIGAGQFGEQAAQAEQQRIQAMTPDELNAIPAIQQMTARGMTLADAQQTLAQQTHDQVFNKVAPLGAVAGVTTALPLLEGTQGALAKVAGTSRLKRAALGAALEAPTQGGMNVGMEAAQIAAANQVTGENRDPMENSAASGLTGALMGTGFGLAGGAREAPAVRQARAADAAGVPPAPGSLTDVANQITDRTPSPATPPQIGGLKPNDAAAARAGAPPLPGASDGNADTAAAAPPPSEAISPADNSPLPPVNVVLPWVDQATGVVGTPTKGQLTSALADYITQTYQTRGHMRINAGDIADAWGVPKADINRARNRATELAKQAVRSGAADVAAGQPSGSAGQLPDAATQPAGDQTTASIPFMITQAMKGELRALGHSDADISRMTPDVAHATLQAGERVLGPARDLLGTDTPAADEAVQQAQDAIDAKAATTPEEPTDAQAISGDQAGVPETPRAAETGGAVGGKDLQQPAQAGSATGDGQAGAAAETPKAPDVTPPKAQESADGAAKPDVVPKEGQPVSGTDVPGEAGTAVPAGEGAGSGGAAPKAPEEKAAAPRARKPAAETAEPAPAVADNETPPTGGVSASAAPAPHKVSAAARDAEGMRIKMPDGEMNGRSHVDGLIKAGFTKVESTRAGDKLVHALVNPDGEKQPIKARQLKYAQEATSRSNDAAYDVSAKAHVTEPAPKGNESAPLHPWSPVDAKHSVTYAGGKSSDGRTTFIDKNIPKTVEVEGKTIDAHEGISLHEDVEGTLLHNTTKWKEKELNTLAKRAGMRNFRELPEEVQRLLKQGKPVPYVPAHEVATRAENHFIGEKYGVDPMKYQAALKDGIDKARKNGETANDIPPTLDNKPYANMGESELGRNAEQRTPADGSPEASGAAAKIEDFGETLHGARKHYAEEYAARVNEGLKLDLATEPLSKTWPEPDYAKAIEAGTAPEVASWVHAARDEIPNRPVKGWKKKGWVEAVTALRQLSTDLMSGKISYDDLKQKLEQPEYQGLRDKIGARAELYDTVGHDVSLKGVTLAEHHYALYKGENNVTKWAVEKKAKATGYSNWPTELGVADTKAEAIKAFKKNLDALAPKPKAAKAAPLIIYSRRGQKQFFIGVKVRGNAIDLHAADSAKEAREYLTAHRDELAARVAKMKEVPNERNARNAPRIGIDHRAGADVKPEQFGDAFGFRGVQFGNYVEGPRRQADLNNAYDALMDLAGVLDIPPRALSLNGTLGLAFGARGHGGKHAPAAHYEPNNIVINLTKSAGAGSLAHEWWHGLDNYFASLREGSEKKLRSNNYLTEQATGQPIPGVRDEMIKAFQRVANTIGETGLRERSKNLDKLKTKDYWSTGREMSARSFENYVIAKLADQGAANDYLANIVSEKTFGADHDYPYLKAGEIPAVRAAYDDFFHTVQTKQGDGGKVALFSKHVSDDEEPFYSALTRSVTTGKGAPKVADATVWKQWMDGAQRRGEFKQSEREWLGVDQWLAEQKGKVTRDQLQQYVLDNQVQVKETELGKSSNQLYDEQNNFSHRMHDKYGDGWMAKATPEERAHYDELGRQAEGPNKATKFASYQLPGGKNYKELLLTLPEEPTVPVEPELRKNASGKWAWFANGKQLTGAFVDRDDAVIARPQASRPALLDSANFKSAHFEQPNILAHVRFNERTDADGKKVLFLEEVQSDWHQQGRKYGYDDNSGTSNPGDYPGMAVPDAPLKKEWPMLAMKRMVRYAAENGFDRVAWTTGEQQASRYDLSKQVDGIRVTPGRNDDQVHVMIQRKGAKEFTRINGDTSSVDKAKLADTIGKDLAEKALAQLDEAKKSDAADQAAEFHGVDLKVGGEGMQAFYDRMLPNEINKWAKQFGAKTGTTSIADELARNQFTYTGPEHSLADVENAMKVAQSGGPGIHESPLTGEKTHFVFNRVANEAAIRPVLKAMRNGESFKAAIEKAGMHLSVYDVKEIFGGTLKHDEILNQTDVHSLDITPTMRETALGGLPLFRQGEGRDAVAATASPAQEAHRARIDQLAQAAKSVWKGDDVPEVRVVATPEQLPPGAKVAANGLPSTAYKTAAGMYDGHRVWIVASAHDTDPKGIRGMLTTMAHEGVGHYGVDRIVERELGAGAWTKIESATERLRANPELASPAIRAVLKDVGKRYPGVDAKTYAREFLAVTAERGVRNGLLDRVTTALRRWVRRMGEALQNHPALRGAGDHLANLRLSEHELRQLLVKSDEYLRVGETRQQRVQSRAAMAFSRDGWKNGFPDVVTAHKPGVLRDHPDYAAAKAGDATAALRVARDVVTPDFVKSVRDAIPEGSEPIIVPVAAREAAGENEIPHMAAKVLGHELGLKVSDGIMQADKVSRSGSDSMRRLANQPAFDGPVERGKDYILLDDTLTQGGTLAQLKTHIEREGGNVVLATALTGKDYSRKLALDPDTLRKMRGRFGSIEGWWKQQFGHGFDGLTESEARAALTFDRGQLSPEGLRNRVNAGKIPEIGRVGDEAAGDRPQVEASGASGRVTESPEFKRFFGDSKVVDAKGEPLPVYHGTADDFEAFDPNRSGSVTAHMTANLGTFFAEDRAKAQHYAENASQGVPADERVSDADLRIQKPYKMSMKEFMGIDSPEESAALRNRLKAEGYDGIQIEGAHQWVAFDPTQIKSASENRGTFDPNDARINFSRDDENADPDHPEKNTKRKPFTDASQSIEAIHDTLPTIDRTAYQKVKDWIAGKARDLEPLALGAIQLRHVLELAAEDPTLKDPAKSYAGLYQRMDGERNTLAQDGSAKVDALARWARQPGLAGWLGKVRPEATALYKFMHAVTQLRVDPTNAYEKLLMRDDRNDYKPWTKELIKKRVAILRETALTRSGDDKTRLYDEIKDLQSLPAREKVREQKYPELVRRWNALTPEAQEHFKVMRDHYREQSAALEEATQARIASLDIPEQNRRAAAALVHRNFEDAKVDGVYFPLSRFGDYWISATTKDGEYVFAKYESANQMQLAEKRFIAAGAHIEARGRQDNNYKAKDAPSGTFIGELMGVVKNAPDKVKDDIYQMYLKTLPEMSLRKHGIHRKNIAGYTDDVPRAFANSVFHGAHQVSKAKYGWQLSNTMDQLRERMEARRTVIDSHQAAHADALLGELQRRHDWIMNPTNNKLANHLTSIGFAYYLAASPASAVVNLLQVPQIVLPVLGAHHGWGQATRVLTRSMRDAIRTGGNIDRVLTGEDLRAFKALKEDGTFQRTAVHALAGISEGDALRSSPAYTKVMNAASYMFHTSEVINREGTGIAAFRLARAQGKSFDAAVKYAEEMTNGTHGDYSNANRARYMQGNVSKVALQFKNYSLAMSWLWGRNFYKAFKGETPEVRAVARRTLTGMLGMTGLFAGFLGMPISNALKYSAQAVHAATSDDDTPWDFDTEFRGWLAEHLGQDAANIIADGPASQLGANVASRVSMSDLWFRDADRQLEGEDAYNNLLQSLAGPLGGMIKNMYVGAQQFNQGHTERGIETMLPTFAKNAVKAVRYAKDGVNTLRGDPIVQDVGAAGDIIQALGFQPTKVAQQQRINNSLYTYQQFIQDRRQALINAYAMAQAAGDADGRTDTTEKIRAFNQKYPEIAIGMANLHNSLRQRARFSAEADNGIRLNKKLAGRLREAVGVTSQPGE